MLIQGTHTCIHCGKDFAWYYSIREKNTRFLTVDRIPDNSSVAYMKFSKETGKDELQARCRFCDKFNIIDEEGDT